jgi:hypothetical protein
VRRFGLIEAARGSHRIMTTDGKPAASKDANPADTAPTDPPVYREAPTPEEAEDSHKDDDKTP